jgi:radical SAM superfamily enzyme YgiQ (UPF0313 family)
VGETLLLSCYELGRQPLGLATPLAFLERAGIPARGLDLALAPLDEEAVRRAEFIAVSVPMHTALRIGLSLATRIRELNPDCHLCFFGLYATLNAELLLSSGVDSVLSGECEEEIVARAREGRSSREKRPSPVLERLVFPVPLRRGAPSLERYARLSLPDGSQKLVGAVESSRGCLHLCRHCPIPPVYHGRFFVVPKSTVLADVRQLVESGATHIDFVDADFLNGPGHALGLVRAMSEEFPALTFDFTAKVEHLVKHAGILPELAERGCLFVTSAVESLSDTVLRELDKGHTGDDVAEALEACRTAGIAFRPTFVAFTPWTSRDDYLELYRFLAREALFEDVDPVQLTLRLLIPPGSLLLRNESLEPVLGPLDAHGLTYRWAHPDPEMDRLQEAAEKRVAESVAAKRTNGEIFRELAELAFGDEAVPPFPIGRRTPRLTEDWFC